MNKKLVAAVNRPVGFRIATGNGPFGPRVVALLNGVAIIFEVPNVNVEDDFGDGDEAAVDDRRSDQAPEIRIANGTVDEFIFGKGSKFTSPGLTNGLCILLRDELEEINAACQLTPPQREKLALAGRGDIKRFVDRVSDVKARLETTDNILNEDQFRDWLAPFGATHD